MVVNDGELNYFINHNNQTTQWDDPRIPGNQKVEEEEPLCPGIKKVGHFIKHKPLTSEECTTMYIVN